MLEINPQVEEEISERINFRLLVYLYMCQHPEVTKASIAQRLGITPITMSRAIAAEKKGIDKELVPGVLELMSEVDFSGLILEANRVQRMLLDQERYDREKKVRSILCKKLSCSPDRLVSNSGVPIFADFVLTKEDGIKRYFDEKPGDATKVRLSMRHTLLNISRIPGNEEITLLCYNQDALSMLMGKYMGKMLIQANLTHPMTVMLVDLDREEIAAEYILYEPGKELFYDLDDDSEFEGTDK